MAKPEKIVAKIFLLNIPITTATIEAYIFGLFSISIIPFVSKKIPGKIIAGNTADGT